ncbi:unnamed protein product, partial [Gordionus sp. m RMFG-2023]
MDKYGCPTCQCICPLRKCKPCPKVINLMNEVVKHVIA